MTIPRSVPPVEELLDVDRDFRRHAAESSEPFFHTTRDGRRYSALYSRSSQALQFHKEHDWVVIDLEEPGPNPRWTVVTERRGVLKGKRVVRGREAECFRHHAARRLPRKPRRLPAFTPVFI